MILLLAHIWNRLTLPQQPIDNEEQLYRYRLLAGILSVIILAGSALLLHALAQIDGSITDDGNIVFGVIAVLIAFALYVFLRRFRQVSTVAAALIIIALLFTTLSPFIPGSRETIIYFTLLPILLSAMLLKPRHLLLWLVTLPVLFIGIRQFGPALGLRTELAEREINSGIEHLLLLILCVCVFVNEIWTLAKVRSDRLQQVNEALRLSQTALEQRVADSRRELELTHIELARLYQEQSDVAEKLGAVDSVRGQFLSGVSHKLRSPLSAILNFTEIVALGMVGPVNDKQRDALDKALESARHLLGLINNLLDMTKIEAGVMELLVEEDVDLEPELADLRDKVLAMLHDKPIRYVEDIDPDLPKLVGDRRRITQILFNLVTNAVTFTKAGTITLSVKRRGDDLLFAIIDTGPGIPAEQQQMIFEPSSQRASARGSSDMNLGLPISNWLVTAHGGRLWLESEPDQGSAFFFTLPIRSPALVAQVNRQ